MIKDFLKNNPVKRILMTSERNGNDNDNDTNKTNESMTTTTSPSMSTYSMLTNRRVTNRLNYKIESMVLG